MNRLSNDLSINDKIITVEFVFLMTNTQMFLCHLFGVFYVYYVFSKFLHLGGLLIVIAVFTYFYVSYFSLSFKINKLEQQLIVPINTKYSELLDGLPVIRAYKKMEYILDGFWSKMKLFSAAGVLRYITDGKIRLLVYSTTNFLAIANIMSLLYLS